MRCARRSACARVTTPLLSEHTNDLDNDNENDNDNVTGSNSQFIHSLFESFLNKRQSRISFDMLMRKWSSLRILAAQDDGNREAVLKEGFLKHTQRAAKGLIDITGFAKFVKEYVFSSMDDWKVHRIV